MSSAPRDALIKHNPAFLTPAELRAAFVVRTRELDLLKQLVAANDGSANQHVLVIAPRGMGKTMLLRRLAQAVGEDAVLSRRWLPVPTAEELYDVATAGEFWLAILGSASSLALRDPSRWQEAYGRLRTESDPKRLRQQTLARLRELSDEEGRRLLVIVENLNMVLGDQASDDAGWDLRETLLNEPRIMLVGSATVRFDEIERADRPLYELFRLHDLPPLTTDECRTLWERVTGEALTPLQARPTEILTGGNPRLLAILASFAVGRSFDMLLQDLTVLVDDHTTYFKANVEALPPQERRVFVKLAEIWEPAPARRVAEEARLNVNTTSALLKRLAGRGAVSVVDRHGRQALYQLTERLYNIYHLMRQSSSESERARAVVAFMVGFYRPAEAFDMITAEAKGLTPERRLPHLEACRYLVNRYGQDDELTGRLVQTGRDDLSALPEFSALASAVAPSQLRAAAELEELMTRLSEVVSRGDTEETIRVYDEVVARFAERPEPELAVWVAWALVNKGLTLGQLGRSEEEIRVYDEVVARFAERPEPELAEGVARALVNKGFTLGQLGRSEEAIRVYDEVVARFADRPEPELAEGVARALFNKGLTLGQLGRSEEAIRVYDEVVARFADRPEPELAVRVARALVNKGFTLGQLGRWEDVLMSVRPVLTNHSSLEVHGDSVQAILIACAANGLHREVLGTLRNTAAARKLEPLLVALQMMAGEDYSAPQEVVEVARDVVQRIRAPLTPSASAARAPGPPAVPD
ncbi:MAG: tetratricopeptide repeat protein [Candidatus Eiseniibacteriota bacterium]